MKLYFLKQKSLDLLERSVTDNINKYNSDEEWVEKFFVDNDNPKYYFDTGIEVDDFELIPGGPETDFKNAQSIFEAFKGKLNPVQASDLRLWAYLAHIDYWGYMRRRWTIDMSDEEDEEEERSKKSPAELAISRIGTRYFFKASKGKAFVRQGIARLYWGAYLTYDENNDNDPYEYTKYFFSKQDIFSSVTERSFARNKTFVLAALKELKKYPNIKRPEIRMFLAKLNQVGALTVIDALSDVQAEELCKSVMSECMSSIVLEEGRRFNAVNDITGKSYGPELIIKDGKATALGRTVTTKPKSLIGKQEGDKFQISGTQYVISDIK